MQVSTLSNQIDSLKDLERKLLYSTIRTHSFLIADIGILNGKKQNTTNDLMAAKNCQDPVFDRHSKYRSTEFPDMFISRSAWIFQIELVKIPMMFHCTKSFFYRPQQRFLHQLVLQKCLNHTFIGDDHERTNELGDVMTSCLDNPNINIILLHEIQK